MPGPSSPPAGSRSPHCPRGAPLPTHLCPDPARGPAFHGRAGSDRRVRRDGASATSSRPGPASTPKARPKGFVMLPSGRLDVRAGDPVESLDEDATTGARGAHRTRGRRLPAAHWTFSTADDGGARARSSGQPLPLEMTLISGWRGVRPGVSPRLERDGAESGRLLRRRRRHRRARHDRGRVRRRDPDPRPLHRQAGDRPGQGLYDAGPHDYSEKLKTCPTKDWADGRPADRRSTFTCTSYRTVVVVAVRRRRMGAQGHDRSR